MSDNIDMPPAYDPRETEDKWYAFWEEQGLFAASSEEGDERETFTIAIPPPNVTGSLHMGHACRVTFEDTLIRHARMSGKNTLWVPGLDHAGIATQVVVERKLAKEGISRHDLGREEFIKRVWQWKEESGGKILHQLRKLGASCDWDRTHFTMDPDLAIAVRESFVRLYEEGLIYRATRLVNWDIATQTVLSDLEVETQENVEGELFEFAYPIDGEDGEVVVATTRPETMLGDTAVAIHPDDERYTHLHGKFVKHPFVDRRIPIICDAELVDMAFGTGVVKVTPAHDPNDFATGKRHDLEEINILNKDGTLNEEGGPFAGLERFKARKAVKAKLDEVGLARGSKKHMMTLPRSQRSGTVVEPMISTQWFVKTEPLAKPAIEAVESGKVKIIPEEWNKTYFHWMRNIQDWCISRQLWWGHSIPAWYCGACEHVNVAHETPPACTQCGSDDLTQDEDVLDTWFSSALWPFSTLGWPDKTPDLERFYPTQDLETGFDILFFWVARMIMMGIHFMGEVPFNRVLLSGMVTDEEGNKMSKVKGNVIDPLDVIGGTSLESLVEKAMLAPKGGDKRAKKLKKLYPEGFAPYGADSLRFWLLSFSPQTRKMAMSIPRVEGYRNFCNKLWNAARFSLMKLEGRDVQASGPPANPQSLANRWILSRLGVAAETSTKGVKDYRLDESTLAQYHFVWHELCDWYLELSKPLFESEDPELVKETEQTLIHAIEATLRMMHPMVPFVTEEIWQRVPKKDAPISVSIAPYPTAEADGARDEASEADMKVLQDFVTGARTIRAEHDLPRATKIKIHWFSEDAAKRDVITEQKLLIESLTGASLILESDFAAVDAIGSGNARAATFVIPGVRGNVPDVVNLEKERARVERELARVIKEFTKVEKKLGNASFIDRAPADVVQREKTKMSELAEKRTQLDAALSRLA